MLGLSAFCENRHSLMYAGDPGCGFDGVFARHGGFWNAPFDRGRVQDIFRRDLQAVRGRERHEPRVCGCHQHDRNFNNGYYIFYTEDRVQTLQL